TARALPDPLGRNSNVPRAGVGKHSVWVCCIVAARPSGIDAKNYLGRWIIVKHPALRNMVSDIRCLPQVKLVRRNFAWVAAFGFRQQIKKASRATTRPHRGAVSLFIFSVREEHTQCGKCQRCRRDVTRPASKPDNVY